MNRRTFFRLIGGCLIGAPIAAKAAIDPHETAPPTRPVPMRAKWNKNVPILLIPYAVHGAEYERVLKTMSKYYNVRRTMEARVGYRTEFPLHFYRTELFTERDWEAVKGWECAMTPWARSRSVYAAGRFTAN